MSLKQSIKSALFRLTHVVTDLGDEKKPVVLLTFDDGPHPEITPQVLERLKHFQARAVFFVIGENASRYPELVKRIIAEGHEVGNHTYSHCTAGARKPVHYLREIIRCQTIVSSIIGRRPRLFRPPKGQINFGSMIAPLSLRLKTIYWSVDPKDYRLTNEEEALVCAAECEARINKGAIVLLHDVNPCVLRVLDTLLPRLADRQLDLHQGVELLRGSSGQ